MQQRFQCFTVPSLHPGGKAIFYYNYDMTRQWPISGQHIGKLASYEVAEGNSLDEALLVYLILIWFSHIQPNGKLRMRWTIFHVDWNCNAFLSLQPATKYRCLWLARMVIVSPDSKVHGANMGPTWVLSAPDGPHVGPMNIAIRVPLHAQSDIWYLFIFAVWIAFFMITYTRVWNKKAQSTWFNLKAIWEMLIKQTNQRCQKP